MAEQRPHAPLASRLRRDLSTLLQLALFSWAWVLAFDLRFTETPPRYILLMLASLPLVFAIKLVAFFSFKLHRGSLRYAGIRDLEGIVLASGAAGAAGLIVLFLVRAGDWLPIPRSIFLIDAMVSILLLGGLRFVGRVVRSRLRFERRSARRIAIVGAGDAAEQLLREIDRSPAIGYRVVALFDDDRAKHGLRLHGVPVVGSTSELGAFVAGHAVDEVVIATPSATGHEMRRLIATCRSAEVEFRVVPALGALIGGRITWSAIRPVDIRDLLGRSPVELDQQKLAGLLQDRTVLITGAGGSIGSELVRQVIRWNPARVIALDQAENPIFELQRSLKDGPPVRVVPVICDVRDEARIDAVFRRWRPAVVLHAAAHKHVPLMERNVLEALKNNVLGTRCVANAAGRHSASHFVMVSTDKAVNPTSVMGTTKRMAELVVQELGETHADTRFIAVRFGNVLGSRGSVVPIFKDQIAKGGPVTVTHKEMVRYFMMIPEASQLVLQAAALGGGGEVFILDMGDPVKIVDLARDLIRLSGLEPDVDVQIEFSGIRPGEKLYEELALEAENAVETHHPKILVGQVRRAESSALLQGLERLESVLATQDLRGALDVMRGLVPEATLTARIGDVSLTRIRVATASSNECA
jgi:FlaA1/EpsC-like NDP-sugar epimerase